MMKHRMLTTLCPLSPSRLLLCALLTVLPAACTQRMQPTQPDAPPPPIPPADLPALLGQTITVEGEAQNWKVGPAINTGTYLYWIDLLGEWPETLQGRRLRVTGTLIERHDLPVFIPRDDELPIAGIPVPEGTDLHKASHRYLLTHATWSLLPSMPWKRVSLSLIAASSRVESKMYTAS